MKSFRDSRIVQIASIMAIVLSIIYAIGGHSFVIRAWDYVSKIDIDTEFATIFGTDHKPDYKRGTASPTVAYDMDTYDQNVNVESYSESYSVTVAITQSQKYKDQYYPAPTDYIYPTYSYPTKSQSQIEWEEDFDKKWDELQKYNDQKNKEVQESQKKFCEENPNLCNR